MGGLVCQDKMLDVVLFLIHIFKESFSESNSVREISCNTCLYGTKLYIDPAVIDLNITNPDRFITCRDICQCTGIYIIGVLVNDHLAFYISVFTMDVIVDPDLFGRHDLLEIYKDPSVIDLDFARVD